MLGKLPSYHLKNPFRTVSDTGSTLGALRRLGALLVLYGCGACTLTPGLFGDPRLGPLPWREEDLLVVSALSLAAPYLADALVLLGVLVMTLGVYGVIRMPDTYTRLHAASKAAFLGVVSLCASSVVTGHPAIIYRA